MKTLAIITTCDARGCGTAPAMPYDLARQYGLPRSIDLCAQHAAPLEALLAQSNAAHGTVTRYQDGCRCMDCRRSATRRRQVERLRARARGLSPQDPRHGTNNAYTNLACRCEPCRTAAQEHRNAATRPLQLTGRPVSA